MQHESNSAGFTIDQSEEARRDLAAGRLDEEKLRGLAWLIENLEDTLTSTGTPEEHHKHLKSPNMLERLNQELKRRTHVIRIFPNNESALRLIRAFRDHVPFACREITERPAPVVRSAELEDSALDGCLGKSAKSGRAEFACDRSNKKWPFCERPLLILLPSVWVNELLSFKRTDDARRQGNQEQLPATSGSFHHQERLLQVCHRTQCGRSYRRMYPPS